MYHRWSFRAAAEQMLKLGLEGRDTMPTWYYRYVSNPPEAQQILDERKIQSLNPLTNYLTWYTPIRYPDANLAQQELAMPYTPTHRMGPFPNMYIETINVPLRLSSPAYGFPGGGLEMATNDVIWLCGLWNFKLGTWDL